MSSGLNWTVRRHRAGRAGTTRGRGARLAAGFAVVVLGIGAIAAAGTFAATGAPLPGWHRVPTAVAWRAPVVGAPAGAPVPGPTGTPAPAPAGVPTKVRIPAIGVEAALVDLHLEATGALAAPADYDVPGWYADGTPPGDVGPAVIAGHVDSLGGPAVFFRLHELRPGDRVEVARGGRWLAFEVVSTGRYPKDEFPTAQVYGPTPDRQLRLITCGGRFDETSLSYRDNIVVFAVAI